MYLLRRKPGKYTDIFLSFFCTTLFPQVPTEHCKEVHTATENMIVKPNCAGFCSLWVITPGHEVPKTEPVRLCENQQNAGCIDVGCNVEEKRRVWIFYSEDMKVWTKLCKIVQLVFI